MNVYQADSYFCCEEKTLIAIEVFPGAHPFVEPLIATLRRQCLSARYSGPRLTWRPSYSIFNIIIANIERTPDAMGTRR